MPECRAVVGTGALGHYGYRIAPSPVFGWHLTITYDNYGGLPLKEGATPYWTLTLAGAQRKAKRIVARRERAEMVA